MVSAFLTLTVVIIAVMALAGWFVADEIRKRALISAANPGQDDLEVVDIQKGHVTLRVTPLADEDGPWRRQGIWGLKWEGGYGQVGQILNVTGRQVVREFHPLREQPLSEQPAIGEMARLDSFAFPDDPEKRWALLSKTSLSLLPWETWRHSSLTGPTKPGLFSYTVETPVPAKDCGFFQPWLN